MSKVSNRVLYVVSLNHATNDGSVYLLSSLFPVVLSLFDISVLQVGIIVSLGYLVNVLFQPVIGHYGEGRDPARLLALGIALITISIISFIFATGFLSLLASVVLLRLGSSFFHPVGISTVSRTYDGPALQKAMGFQSAFGNLGVLLTFLTAAPLYLLVGWRSTFLVFAIWTMMDILLTLTVLRSKISRESSNPLAESHECCPGNFLPCRICHDRSVHIGCRKCHPRHRSASCKRVCDILNLSSDLHGTVPLPGSYESESGTFVWTVVIKPDHWSFNLRSGERVHLAISRARSGVWSCCRTHTFGVGCYVSLD